MNTDSTNVGLHDDGAPAITIPVNEIPVTLSGKQHTATEIKQAAINQGLPIDQDFVLSVEGEGHQGKVIGNDEVVDINEHTRISAVADDDNS